MKTGKIIFLVLVFFTAIFSIKTAAFSQTDCPGSQDHQLFSRMPGYYISEYEENEFDSHEFYVGAPSPVKVEGHKFTIIYQIKEGEKVSSPKQIVKNYTGAIKSIGGTVSEETSSQAFMKLSKKNAQIWSALYADSDGERYKLVIVEKAALVQEVIANAEVLARDLKNTGHVAVYGIYFDSGKSDLKPESEPTLAEIARLLKNNQNLKLYVVGHTDNVGQLTFNLNLSEARAAAVVKTLTTQYSVAADRLSAHGMGPLVPVASNKTEAGRAENRRVELVEK